MFWRMCTGSLPLRTLPLCVCISICKLSCLLIADPRLLPFTLFIALDSQGGHAEVGDARVRARQRGSSQPLRSYRSVVLVDS